MRYTLFIIIICIALSCQSKDVEKKSSDLFYAIDTVMIDSKGEIMYLEYNMVQSDYCTQDGFLYNFNEFDHSIEKIDLDRLELVEKFPFQKEGPDGTGLYIYSLKSLGDSKIFLLSENVSAVFSTKGKMLKKFDWNKVSPADGAIADEEFLQQQIMNPNFNHLVFGLAIDETLNRVSLKKLDASQNLISTYQIDPNENFERYTLGDLETFNKWNPNIYIGIQQEQIIVSHQFSNDLYVYSPGKDLLKSVSYSPQLTPKNVTFKAEGDLINSSDDRIIALESYLGQVSFGQLVWDSPKKKYYRLSFASKFSDKKREKRLLHETVSVKVFLSVFDEQFIFLSEVAIPEIKILSPSKYFVKDGKIWLYQNFSDELGFITIDIEQ